MLICFINHQIRIPSWTNQDSMEGRMDSFATQFNEELNSIGFMELVYLPHKNQQFMIYPLHNYIIMFYVVDFFVETGLLVFGGFQDFRLFHERNSIRSMRLVYFTIFYQLINHITTLHLGKHANVPLIPCGFIGCRPHNSWGVQIFREVRELFKRLPVRHKEFMRNCKSQVTRHLEMIWPPCRAWATMTKHTPVHLFVGTILYGFFVSPSFFCLLGGWIFF